MDFKQIDRFELIPTNHLKKKRPHFSILNPSINALQKLELTDDSHALTLRCLLFLYRLVIPLL